jgi:FAD/FMN-containing dehydrogenase
MQNAPPPTDPYPSDPEILAALAAIVGAQQIVQGRHDLERYESDWRGRYRGATLCAVRPKSTEEVAAVVRYCHATQLAIVPQGGNTGMSAGALPPSALANIVLCLDRMARVRELDLAGNTLTVEAGCTLAAVQQRATDSGRLFPMALGSQGSCHIGGNVSTNAGGTAVLRFGNMRDLVLGLEVVLPDGRIWNGLRKLRKDNTGYDLKQLFIGAEGTLGIVTAATLKLFPAPKARSAAWVGIESLELALALLAHMQARCGERLCGFEVMSRGQLDLVLRHVPGTRDPLTAPVPWSVLVDAADSGDDGELAALLETSLGEALDHGTILDAAVASSGQQRADFWRLRDSVSEANRKSGYSVSHDTSVPVAQIPEFVRRATAALQSRSSTPLVVAVGHVGDGNIHLVAIFDPAGRELSELQHEASAASADVHRISAELQGSISAEHGIGSVKREALAQYKGAVELDLMRGIKNLLDPGNLMNPGKILDLPSAARDSHHVDG